MPADAGLQRDLEGVECAEYIKRRLDRLSPGEVDAFLRQNRQRSVCKAAPRSPGSFEDVNVGCAFWGTAADLETCGRN